MPKSESATDAVTWIKQCLSDPLKCSSTTVAEVKQLLGDGGDDKQCVPSRGGVKIGARLARKGAAQPTRRKHDLAIHEEPQTSLSRCEQKRLATTIVNLVLEILARSRKEASAAGPLKQKGGIPSSKPVPDKSAKQFKRKAPIDRSLAERSVNRTQIGAKVKTEPGTRKAAAIQAPEPESLSHVIQCCHAAFAFLRSETVTPDWQLEDGVLAFTSSLISLGAFKLATEELRALHHRIQAKLLAISSNDISPTPEMQVARHNGMVELFHFGNVPDDERALLVTIGHQLQLLRLLHHSKQAPVLGPIVPLLGLDHVTSTVSLIQRLHNMTSNTEQAVLQLNNLSYILLSLCPSLSASQDTVACDKKLYPNPEDCLRMQALALHTRLSWMCLSKCQESIDVEIWRPFLKCLAAFIRRSNFEPSKAYSLSLKCFKLVRTGLSGTQGLSEPDPAYTDVAKLLTDLANRAGVSEDIQSEGAIKSKNRTVNTPPSATRCVQLAKSAAKLLNDMPKSSTQGLDLPALHAVFEIFEYKSTHDHDQDDGAISAAIEIRNAAAWYLKTTSGFFKPSSDTSVAVAQKLCHRLLSSCLEFFACLLDAFHEGDKPDLIRLGFLRDVASPGIDLILRTCAGLRGTMIDKDLWLATNTDLENSLKLATARIPDLPVSLPSIAENSQESAVKSKRVHISNAHFQLHIACKDVLPDQSIQSLLYSCAALDSASPMEKRQGALPMKLAKLGRLNLARKNLIDANHALVSSIKESLSLGVLDGPFPDPDSLPLKLVWGDCENRQVFDDTLSSMLILALENDMKVFDGQDLFDNPNLPVYTYGLFLELQIRRLIRWTPSSRSKDRLQRFMSSLGSTLLKIYETHPIASLRVCCQILQVASNSPAVFDSRLVQDAEACVVSKLQSHSFQHVTARGDLRHLYALSAVEIAIRDLKTHETRLSESLDMWNSLVSEKCTLEDLLDCVGNVDQWLAQLSHLDGVLQLSGMPYCQILTLRIIAAIERLKCGSSFTSNAYREALLAIAKLLSRLGYSERAGSYLDLVYDENRGGKHDHVDSMSYRLTLAEYHLALGNLDNCRAALMHLEDTYGDEHAQSSAVGQRHDRSQNLQRIREFAEYHYLSSQLQYQLGNFIMAFQHAKLELRSLQMVWDRLQKLLPAVPKQEPTPDGNAGLADLTNDFRELSVKSPQKPMALNERKEASPSMSILTHVFFGMLRGYRNLASLTYGAGLFLEASNYLIQAQQLADVFAGKLLRGEILMQRGDYAVRSGNLLDGQRLLIEADELFESSEKCKTLVDHCQSLGHFHQLQQSWEDESRDYDRAEAVLQLLQDAPLPDLTPTKEQNKKPLPAKEANILRAAQLKPASSRRGLAASSRKSTSAAVSVKRQASSHPEKTTPNAQLSALQYSIHLSKAESVLAQADLAACSDMLSASKSDGANHTSGIQLQLLQARLLVKQALDFMGISSVFGMLSDSTLSVPSAAISASRASVTVARVAKKQQKPFTASPAKKHSPDSGSQISGLLEQALQSVTQVQADITLNFPIAALDRSISTLSTAATLLVYLQSELASTSSHSTVLARTLALPQSIAAIRNRSAVFSDRLSKLKTTPKTVLLENGSGVRPLAEYNRIHHELCFGLPKSWIAVSMSLDENQNHLMITKYMANRCPFVIQLPLARQNEDTIEETFSFNDARKEFLEIVEQSDSNVHSARDDPDRLKVEGAKCRWWAEREALDERMRNLLLNIEGIWLAGFRGILSQSVHEPTTLSRFQQSFENILDKHLPSRQRSKQRGQSHKVSLDRHVFELFASLGPLIEPQLEFGDSQGEALNDLLYYVVDIMQFNGEVNAYDEIDFDSMTVEIHSALQLYLEAAGNDSRDREGRHTILVLDKQLHTFPWESLPCLEGQSVSRVSSIVELHERIMAMEKQSSEIEGLQVSPANGTYILNPGGDLNNTQSRFQAPLSTLSASPRNWSSIVERNPTAEEFLAALKHVETPTSSPSNAQNRILLYFGHGSGEQYLTHRRIKALRYQHWSPSPDSIGRVSHPEDSDSSSNPAPMSLPTMNAAISVPLLFGCSSASLKLHGEFEPHGTPQSYLCAGAPALLGSLWDVTDGDIDRFASNVLERWGLLEGGTFAAHEAKSANGRKSKGRAARKLANSATSKNPESEADFGKMSLSDAVARSRGQCYLKYLNGAAMVVYGVPVYLETK